MSQKKRNPGKEAQFERVKINFIPRTCIVWLKYRGISHLERIYTQLVIIWRRTGVLAFLGGDFQKLNEFKKLKLKI